MGKALDLTGQRFGRLTAVRPTDRRSNGHIVWECECDCGTICEVAADVLKRGSTRSCGCLRGQTWNMKCVRLYNVWRGIHRRCENPSCENYRNYGLKGISVCPEWADYREFEKWAFENGYDKDAPHNTQTIDRIDVDGDYSPENCRLADMKTQARNRRNNRGVVGQDGSEYRTVTEFAEEIGLSVSTAKRRILSGTPIDGVVYRYADK